MKKSNNISLKNDYAFTQIMKQPKILRGFLSSILHIPPEKIGTIHIKTATFPKIFWKESFPYLICIP